MSDLIDASEQDLDRSTVYVDTDGDLWVWHHNRGRWVYLVESLEPTWDGLQPPEVRVRFMPLNKHMSAAIRSAVERAIREAE
ncbi:hypothetical protein SEA_ALEEMILY_138 [Gordonia phage Aleemily]|nr:hypothetical protein SEA_ALEEMILY_138 [Gordonia phage Aleemily]